MNEVVPYKQTPAITSLDDVMRLAEVVHKSNLYGVKNVAEAVVKILTGMEAGFSPMASLAGVHVIEGKPSLGAHMMAAAVKRSGRYDFRVLQHTDEVCELEFFEQGKPVGKSTFTIQDAISSGLVFASENKGVKVGDRWWKKNWATAKRNMLFARTVSNGYKWFCADLSGGMLMYDPDELEPAAEPVQLEAKPAANGHVPEKPAEQPAAPAAPPATTPSAMISRGQQSEMDSLMLQLGVTEEQLQAKLREAFNLDDWRKLTYQQAERLLKGLRSKRAAQQGNGNGSPGGAIPAAAGSPSASA